MAARYVRGRVGFNVSIRDDLNMRFFEIPSTGACMLANRDQVGWDVLGFEDGVHFLGFDTMDEMADQVRWALKNPLEREQIAQAGHALVREHHTYIHRMQRILSDFKIELPHVQAQAA